ncbi:MAG: hypothetical protein WAP35_06855 [Solirubrobacterales bacterium]
MSLKCLYVDLDGTLLGKNASLFHDGDGRVSRDGARAIEACLRAEVEVCIFSGRREAQVHEGARLFGQSSYIFEVGCGVHVDGETEWLTGGLEPTGEHNIYEQVELRGVPALLLDEYSDRLEYHAPWHLKREVSHLFRGWVDTVAVDQLLTERGHGDLRLVDNGRIHRKSEQLALDVMHAYHLIPRVASKSAGVARHMQIRGYASDEVIAAGDSVEDMEVANVVGQFFLMRNAVEQNPGIEAQIAKYGNVGVTEERYGAGVYEAVVGTLMER